MSDRDTLRAQQVEVGLVFSEQLEILDGLPTTQRAVGEVQRMIGLVVGLVRFEHVHATINALEEADLLRKLVNDTYSARRQGAIALRQIEVQGSPGEHRQRLSLPFAISEAIVDSALAAAQLSGSIAGHSKRSFSSYALDFSNRVVRARSGRFERFSVP
ncbi:MAG: hypothetical protein IPN34_23055 [Planctomycetes bacterium]|nr:hypothetical protein [Planctomycetota bacterium]